MKLKRGWITCVCGSPHPGWWSHGLPMTEVQKHIALPHGWRWLRVGEWTQRGDVLTDPRVKPVTIVLGARRTRDEALTENHHPVRRRLRAARGSSGESNV